MLIGQAGDPAFSSFVYRGTLWDADGSNPRFVTGLDAYRSRVYAINESGVYVGNTSTLVGSSSGGFVGQNGAGEPLVYPGFRIIGAADINDSNWLIGAYTPDNFATLRGYIARAFGPEIHDLGSLEGYVGGVIPRAINNAGAIVGLARQGPAGNIAAYWPPGATSPTDFNLLAQVPGDTLVEAMDINNAGQILARGFNGYYIFTPVPEPATAGLIALLSAAANRRRPVASCSSGTSEPAALARTRAA